MPEIIELAVNTRGTRGQNSGKKDSKRFSVILNKGKNCCQWTRDGQIGIGPPKYANNSIAEMY